MAVNNDLQVPETASVWLLRANYLLLLVGCALNAAPLLVLLITHYHLNTSRGQLLHAHWRWQCNSAALFITMRSFSFALLWLEPVDGSIYGIALGLIGETIWLLYRTLKGTIHLYLGSEPVRRDSL